MNNQNFTIVDVETTGASSQLGRIIEIGILRIESGAVVETYQTLLNPVTPIPDFITRMTGIGDRDVMDAPMFVHVAERVLALCENSTFVAHNAPFDYSFFEAEFARMGTMFSMPRLCTVQLSRAFYPEERHHNLGALIERHGLQYQRRHRAFDDAHVLWQFLQLLAKAVPEGELERQVRRLTRG